jgi:low affinity Fe/Cu permease
LDWHGIASLATLFMTLFIQRSEHRDTQAIHAKLDELLRVNGDARNQLTRLDDREPEQVEAFRNKVREETDE